MRIFLTFFICVCALFGCSQNHGEGVSAWLADDGKLKVLATTAMIDDLVEEIGKDRVSHTTLIIGEMDPHSYELVKGDDEKISLAQIVIGNGLNLEHGASLHYQLEQHPNVVFLGEEIKKRVPDQILSSGTEYDPHVWMDISLWAEGIESIVVALSDQDPENAMFYQKNGELLRQKMLKAHQKIKEDLRGIPQERRYLVTSHDAFHYFTRAYLVQDLEWEERCVAPEGIAPEGQLSSVDIQRVIEHLHRYHIEVVFPESNVSRDALKKITACCGHKVRICKQFLYGDAMGGSGSDADNYLGMLQHNARVLKEEWEK